MKIKLKHSTLLFLLSSLALFSKTHAPEVLVTGKIIAKSYNFWDYGTFEARYDIIVMDMKFYNTIEPEKKSLIHLNDTIKEIIFSGDLPDTLLTDRFYDFPLFILPKGPNVYNTHQVNFTVTKFILGTNIPNLTREYNQTIKKNGKTITINYLFWHSKQPNLQYSKKGYKITKTSNGVRKTTEYYPSGIVYTKSKQKGKKEKSTSWNEAGKSVCKSITTYYPGYRKKGYERSAYKKVFYIKKNGKFSFTKETQQIPGGIVIF